jgi:hypothetical protein
MSTTVRRGAGVLLALVVGVGIGFGLGHVGPASGQAEGGAQVAPRYSVVDTEGHNLIVTDNKTNILYFYTIDPDAEIGSDLKLRGSADLNQVGKAVLVPKLTKKKKN